MGNSRETTETIVSDSVTILTCHHFEALPDSAVATDPYDGVNLTFNRFPSNKFVPFLSRPRNRPI